MMEHATARTESLYRAIERLPDGVVGEIIDGQLHAHPRPSGRHIAVASRLGARLAAAFDFGDHGPGGWWILDEPEIHFRCNSEVLVPDLAGWHRDRLAEMPEDQRFDVVPDWICEVLSPSTASADRQVKMPVYARWGVPYAWLVDPPARTVEAYALDAGEWRAIGTTRADEPIRAAPFGAVAIPPPWA